MKKKLSGLCASTSPHNRGCHNCSCWGRDLNIEILAQAVFQKPLNIH